MLTALLDSLIPYTNLRFHPQNLQQKELAKSAAESLQQEELAAAYALTAESLQQKELANLPWLKSFQPCPTRAIQLQSFQLITVQLCFPNQLSVDQLDAFQETGFQTRAALEPGISASAFQDPGTAATATAAAFCTAASIASSLRLSRTKASTVSPTTMTTTTTTTATTPRKPSFNQQWAQKSLAPQPGSFISNFQGELQQSASTPTTGTNQRVEELEETNGITTMAEELEKYCAELRKHSTKVLPKKFARD